MSRRKVVEIEGQMSFFDLLNAEANVVNDADVKPEKEEASSEPSISVDELAKLLLSVPTDTEEGSDAEEVTEKEDTASKASVLPEPINFTLPEKFEEKKASFAANVKAIRLLKELEEEDRMATREEQAVLAGYSGWGGLPEVFDKRKDYKGRDELKSLLTDEEYESAGESCLTAFYTPYEVVKAIWKTLTRWGVKGNVLDPCCGTGRFLSAAPEDVHMYGIELDSVSARIARQLYQKDKIEINGFEKSSLPDNMFTAAVGNVPFGNYGVPCRKYDKYHFLIHDFFFAKALDMVEPKGIIAFITSTGTMDKRNSSVREYIAQRADLIGAIRMPEGTFSDTKAVADIIFLQKRESMATILPSWVKVQVNPEGYTLNSYFIEHPEMILGTLAMESSQFGERMTVHANGNLVKQLAEAMGKLKADAIPEGTVEEEKAETVPADPSVKNFSYTLLGGEVYYRENSIMKKEILPKATEERLKGMIGIRDALLKLLNAELTDKSEEEIKNLQGKLNESYDYFIASYGTIHSAGNRRAMRDDSSYCLIAALEEVDSDGNVIGKADTFTKRTIRKAIPVTHVDTAVDALSLSMAEKAAVDFLYMERLTDKSKEELTSELKGLIFEDPETHEILSADEYLSGNIRQKLALAKGAAMCDPKYNLNVESLKKVLPKDLDASEIDVRIGATWIEPEVYTEFVKQQFQLNPWDHVEVQYACVTGSWKVTNKNLYGNNLVSITYGTGRANALRLMEDALNLRDTKIYDRVADVDEHGNDIERRVVNKKETMLAQQKQQAIKDAFKEWIWKDLARRERLVKKYNLYFNNFRPREFDGSHIRFVGMNPGIELRPHQKDAVARILMSRNNALIAYCVGAGKTWAMTAGAMESKRLGLCHKSLFVVPNHLTEQWGSDFLKLYPMANILVATKRDFEPKHRKQFVSRIAMGDYDAIIIGHSQFEKIPLSKERQEATLKAQIAEIMAGLEETDKHSFTQKELMRSKKQLEDKLKKLSDIKQDDVVTFEQLGVDRLFIDEAHFYKNLYLFSKMGNVAGISQTDAKKSTDLFLKCRYLDSIHGKIIFATGTPVSNTMCELYTMQRYLQYDHLKELGLVHFDSWATQFGETETNIELTPEGTGYRAKRRFSKFYNLPELMAIFKEVADIRTQDMMELDVPEAEFINVQLEPSEIQKSYVSQLGDRAELVHSGGVDPKDDNMLKITSDGRKCALDQRLIEAMEGVDEIPDDPHSKVWACVHNVYDIWKETKKDRLTQLVFCDLSTPHGDGKFNVYDDAREKLVGMGIPREEIKFIHEAKTEVQKKELFAKVEAGEVRILFGSTSKLGCGTNIQERLIALHHLDAPWKPADLEQQEGRIIRQGNHNKKVKVFRYVTKGTFDAYMWQILENKQKFISQIMTSKSPVRSCEDVDEATLSYAEVKSLCTGNPLIKEKMELDIDVRKLKVMKANYQSNIYRMESDIAHKYPEMIASQKQSIRNMKADEKDAESISEFVMTVNGVTYDEKKEAGKALWDVARKRSEEPETIGKIGEFDIIYQYDTWYSINRIRLRNRMTYSLTMAVGHEEMADKVLTTLSEIPEMITHMEQKLSETEKQFQYAKDEVKKPFDKEQELAEKTSRLNELNAQLDLDRDFSASTISA